MTPTVRALGRDFDATMRLLAEFIEELAQQPQVTGSGRLGEIAARLAGRQLGAIPATLRNAHTELLSALDGIRQSREALQAYSLDKLRDTHSRLHEVSSTAETATTELLNGLDRTLAICDQLGDGGSGVNAEAVDTLRTEINNLYGCLQFQDIISQQLHGVAAMLVEVEHRMANIAELFEPADATPPAPDSPFRLDQPDSFNGEASIRDVASRQALIDETFARKAS